MAILEATLTDPSDGTAAHNTVDRVRANVHAVPGAHAQVGGDPAIKLDVQRAANRDAQRIVPIVLLMDRQATLTGLAATGGVITSAGVVLAGTFAVLATLPLTVATQLGFAVAFGILLDTLVVRSVLVTALTLDVERHMWWPSRLSRRTATNPLAASEPAESSHRTRSP